MRYKVGVKQIKDFLRKKNFGYKGTKVVEIAPSEHLKVLITAGGFIYGGAVYRVKRRERSSDVLELVGVMPIEEIKEHNLRMQGKRR